MMDQRSLSTLVAKPKLQPLSLTPSLLVAAAHSVLAWGLGGPGKEEHSALKKVM